MTILVYDQIYRYVQSHFGPSPSITVYGKTFAVVHKTHYSLENFRGASGRDHHVLYTANDSRGKLSRLAIKPQKP